MDTKPFEAKAKPTAAKIKLVATEIGIPVIIQEDREFGGMTISCEAFGITTQGRDTEDAKAMIQDAVAGLCEAYNEDGEGSLEKGLRAVSDRKQANSEKPKEGAAREILFMNIQMPESGSWKEAFKNNGGQLKA